MMDSIKRNFESESLSTYIYSYKEGSLTKQEKQEQYELCYMIDKLYVRFNVMGLKDESSTNINIPKIVGEATKKGLDMLKSCSENLLSSSIKNDSKRKAITGLDFDFIGVDPVAWLRGLCNSIASGRKVIVVE